MEGISQSKININEFQKQAKKIVIIGDANVGKTSIITRYVTQTFDQET